MIDAVNTLDSVGLVEGFSLSDLNNNIINSDKEIISETKNVSSNMDRLVRSSGNQESLLDRMNTTLSFMYSDGQSDDLQQQKLRASVDAVGDKIGDNEKEPPTIPEDNGDDDFSMGGVLGIIAGMAGLLLFTPIGKKLGEVGENILRGISYINIAVTGIFKAPLKLLKESKFLKPVFSLFKSIGKIFSAPLKFIKGAGKIFKPFFSIFKLVGKIFSPILKYIPMITKIGGSLAKGVLGKALLPLMTIFDGISGFFNADDISGKKEDMLTTGDKVMASISSIISGFTFGLLDVQGVFKFIDNAWTTLKESFTTAMNFVKGVWNGDIDLIETLSNFTSGIWESVNEWFSNQIDSIKPVFMDVFENVKTFVTDIFNFLTTPHQMLFDFAKDMFTKIQDISFKDFIPESIKTTWIGEKLLDMIGGDESKSEPKQKVEQPIPDMGGQGVLATGPITQTGGFGDILGSAVEPIAQRIDNSDMRESQNRFSETQQANIRNAEDKKPIVVPQIQTVEKPVLVPSRRVMSVDDMGISFMNNGVFD